MKKTDDSITDFKAQLPRLKFDARGLIPAIIREAGSGAVLMLAYMNRESLDRTIETGKTVFWSRSRGELWHKGATSGHTQTVERISVDCDQDALLISVDQKGVACHTGAKSCFDAHEQIPQTNDDAHEESDLLAAGETNKGELRTDAFSEDDLDTTLRELYEVISERERERPAGAYTTYLFDSGLDKILKKVGEEAAETIIAAKNDDPQRLVSETADLFYHLLVMLVERGVPLETINAELVARRLAKQNADKQSAE